MKAIYPIAAVIGVGGFFLGYDVGVISGVLAMDGFKRQFNYPDDWARGFIVGAAVRGRMRRGGRAARAAAAHAASRLGGRDRGRGDGAHRTLALGRAGASLGAGQVRCAAYAGSSSSSSEPAAIARPLKGPAIALRGLATGCSGLR